MTFAPTAELSKEAYVARYVTKENLRRNNRNSATGFSSSIFPGFSSVFYGFMVGFGLLCKYSVHTVKLLFSESFN